MRKLKLFTIIALSALTVACGSNNTNNTADEVATKAHDCTACEDADGCIVGKWIQPIAGQEGKFEGFELKKDGIAESINMATLQIEKWSKDSTTLILTGKSIGNGQTIDFTDTYTIAQGDKNSLTLIKDGAIVWSLSKEGKKGCCKGDSCSDCKETAKAEQPEKDGCSGCGACDK